jgi:hypothetical protein
VARVVRLDTIRGAPAPDVFTAVAGVEAAP